MRRALAVCLIAAAILMGYLAIKRAINGNADLSGNYRHWRNNLSAPALPVRRNGPETEDPDAYPPISYALFAPFGAMPLWMAAAVWYVLNLACSIYLWRDARAWLVSACGRSGCGSGMPAAWHFPRTPDGILALVILSILPAWISTVLLGQNTLLIMLMTWVACRAAARGLPWVTGTLINLATAAKVLPVVFLLPFLCRWNGRVFVAYCVTGLAILFGLGSLYFGFRTNLDFHRRWLEYATRGSEGRPADPHDPDTLRGSLRYHNQSIEAVTARLLVDVPIHNRPGAPQVNVMRVSAATWRRIRTACTLLCVLIGVAAMIRNAHRGHSTLPTSAAVVEDQMVQDYSVASLLQLFISPIVWSHYYVWLFWPLLFVSVSAIRGRRSGQFILLLWIASQPLIAVPVARGLGVHLMVIFILYLWLCWPMLAAQRRVRRVEVPG